MKMSDLSAADLGLSEKDLESMSWVASSAARAARDVALSDDGFRLRAHVKGDGSEVTDGDLLAADAAASFILGRDSRAVIAHEEGAFPPPVAVPDVLWVIDPIDCTAAYARGRRGWASMVGVLVRGVPAVGAICGPDHVHARRLFDREALPMDGPPLDRAAVNVAGLEDGDAFAVWAVRRKIGRARFPSPAHRALVGVALGEADAALAGGHEPFDWVAPAAILMASGGIVTTDGGEAPRGRCNIVAARGAALHAALLEAVR